MKAELEEILEELSYIVPMPVPVMLKIKRMIEKCESVDNIRAWTNLHGGCL